MIHQLRYSPLLHLKSLLKQVGLILQTFLIAICVTVAFFDLVKTCCAVIVFDKGFKKVEKVLVVRFSPFILKAVYEPFYDCSATRMAHSSTEN